ncbi:MAG: ArsR family transcriptional regulator [Chloroflexi bacterium]|nr:MAG: ArsR family transcriptional regulator [Chloroflexota bacterium]
MPSRTAATAADPTVLARLFRVLGDPTRLRIIQLLEDGDRTVGEIVDAVGGLQPRVSTRATRTRGRLPAEHPPPR